MTMTPKEEEAYLAGGDSAWKTILAEALKHLHHNDWTKERLILERSAAIVSLRRLCDEFGIDNDWPDDLHLADIIEKRIFPRTRHLA